MTIFALNLAKALENRGVIVVPEHFDGHKHVDLFLPEVEIYIEVDGIQHLTVPEQIIADFKRNYYSDIEKFNTLHINNEILVKYLEEIADSLAEVVKELKVLKVLEKVNIKQTVNKEIFKN